jgi:hypothetical protein
MKPKTRSSEMTQAIDSTAILHRYVAAVGAGDQQAVREYMDTLYPHHVVFSGDGILRRSR